MNPNQQPSMPTAPTPPVPSPLPKKRDKKVKRTQLRLVAYILTCIALFFGFGRGEHNRPGTKAIIIAGGTLLGLFIVWYAFHQEQSTEDKYFAKTGAKRYMATIPPDQLQALDPSNPPLFPLRNPQNGNMSGHLLITPNGLQWEPAENLVSNGVKLLSFPFASIATCRVTTQGFGVLKTTHLSFTLTNGQSFTTNTLDAHDLVSVLQQKGLAVQVA